MGMSWPFGTYCILRLSGSEVTICASVASGKVYNTGDRTSKEGWRRFQQHISTVADLVEEGRGKIDCASQTKAVEAVLNFAETSQRFQSCAP
ncbi:uncharacterized protein N7503_003947 [Penicillium pulvis]|uniref:uncharacterized protein n=1 Tax=Penicillium pulvis TaxID=1562058 RepID=UPI002547FAFF|nr:uncharacterized protein N7503_003947 [Penicillium pulvis]KAJ5806345.1 hypothetical protein N7503_003947 [Penicillium pulvis]